MPVFGTTLSISIWPQIACLYMQAQMLCTWYVFGYLSINLVVFPVSMIDGFQFNMFSPPDI